MSIATEITRLQGAKAALKSSIEAKGVTVASDATLDAYPTLVNSIPTTTVPKPIVLTGLPTEDMNTQDELDEIGLTTDEMAAAALGLRTGVVCLGRFYGIDMAQGNEFAFSKKSYSGSKIDMLWAAYINIEGGNISVDIAEV